MSTLVSVAKHLSCQDSRSITGWLPLLVLAMGSLLKFSDAAAADNEAMARGFIKSYCMPCHSSEKHKGDTDLEKLAAPYLHADSDHVWESVRNVLAEQSMPPNEKKQPSLAERDKMVAWIDRALDGPNGDKPTDPGWVSARRLSRVEFNNTINDLLGTGGTPADALPSDPTGGFGSFDNNTDTLFVSSLYMERMLNLALFLIEEAKPHKLQLVKPVANADGVINAEAERAAVYASLEKFLPLAWRRPVTPDEIKSLVRIYERSRSHNVTHESALRLAYATSLTSPNFLFRIELEQNTKDPYALSAYELANRLSYFLWSTMPDAALFAAAANKSLLEPAVLKQQLKRLLASPRAKTFAKEFMGQWLGTNHLAIGEGPDQVRYRKEFPHNLMYAMMDEPGEYFYAMVKNNAPLTDVISSNYVVVNNLLAAHYGLAPTPTEKDPRKAREAAKGYNRIEITDGKRGGVLTMAGVLAVTSRPSRTSPVIRGKWILDELLSYPPPPPPPNVPGLEETKDKVASAGTLRQRLEHHRNDPNCSGCHQRIDPLGFGLENYDLLGRWRDKDEKGLELDITGTMPNGETFSGPQELKQILLKRQDRILNTMVERLLSYALGRGLERYDRATVRNITTTLANNKWQSQQLIEEIVFSLPFRYKRNPTVATVTVPSAHKDK